MDTTTFSGEGRHVDEAIRWFHHPFTLAVLTGVSFGPMNVVLCCTTDFSIFQVVFSIDIGFNWCFFLPPKIVQADGLASEQVHPRCCTPYQFFLGSFGTNCLPRKWK